MKIGFIGIGVMGESMARHLMQKGHGLTVFNRTKAKAETLLKEGAAWAESAGACASEQDAVITIVGFPSDVEEVYQMCIRDSSIVIPAATVADPISLNTFSFGKHHNELAILPKGRNRLSGLARLT